MAADESKGFLSDRGRDSISEDSEGDIARSTYDFHRKRSQRKDRILIALIILPWTLLLGSGLWFWRSLNQCKARYYIAPELVYSPLQDVIEYETKIFTTGLPEFADSPYAEEPSDEVDKLWTDLYPSVLQLIPVEQAARLPNRTVLFPHDEQKRYAIELDVFHELHCLNMVRKATRSDYYQQVVAEGDTEDRLLGRRHIAHCIDTIRQSLMCAADVTAYTWSWSEEDGYENHISTPHTCRNFDKIREWSVINTKKEYFDFDYHEPNDPLDPSTWIDGYTGR